MTFDPTTCPIGTKYDYSSMADASQRFSAEFEAHADNGVKYDLSYATGRTKFTYRTGVPPSTTTVTNTTWPQTDIDNDFELQWRIQGEDRYVFTSRFGFFEGTTFRSGIVVDSSGAVPLAKIIVYLVYGVGSINTGFIYTFTDELLIRYVKTGSTADLYVNGVLALTHSYDSSRHAFMSKAPKMDIYGGQAGAFTTKVYYDHAYIISQGQSTDCLGSQASTPDTLHHNYVDVVNQNTNLLKIQYNNLTIQGHAAQLQSVGMMNEEAGIDVEVQQMLFTKDYVGNSELEIIHGSK